MGETGCAEICTLTQTIPIEISTGCAKFSTFPTKISWSGALAELSISQPGENPGVHFKTPHHISLQTNFITKENIRPNCLKNRQDIPRISSAGKDFGKLIDNSLFKFIFNVLLAFH